VLTRKFGNAITPEIKFTFEYELKSAVELALMGVESVEDLKEVSF
jgi:hypothetical protein